MADKDREGGIGRFEIRRGGNKVAEADDMTAARIRGNAEKARYPNEHVSLVSVAKRPVFAGTDQLSR
jgi:hypothetical protein